MRRSVNGLALALFLVFGMACPSRSADGSKPASAPDFQEVYDLISAHLAGVNPGDLNRTAVEALISALGPGVSLVGEPEQESPDASGDALIKKSSLFDGSIAYLRIGQIGQGLPDALRQAYDHIGTNRLSGVVLDLRFSRGDDYAAAAATADLFLKKERPLLNWGNGVVRSKEKAEAITVPVAVLVNRGTARAAEALAAVLRETGAALIIGGRTAGQAMIAQEYPLKNGQKLRIATAPIEVGESNALSVQGVKPDLAVNISLEDERAYLTDAFTDLRTPSTNAAGSSSLALNGAAAAGTNRARRPRFSEAELVRERREGLPPDLELAGRGDSDTQPPVVRDPALARALDLLKGLAVVRRSRS